jgi:hypothetical protein
MQRRALLAALGCAALAGAAALWLASAGGVAARRPAHPAAQVQAEAPTPAQAPVDAARAGETLLAKGETLVLDAATLRPGTPVALRLDLEVASRSDEPRPVRVYSTDGRALELQASLGAQRSEANLELDPAFLTPGRYMVEVKTTELSPLPIRRYVVEVR